MKENKVNYADDLAISAGKKTRERDYWLNRLAGEPVKSSFTPDSPHRSPGETAANDETLRISGDLFSAVMKLSKGSDYTLYVVLLSNLVLLIYKYTGLKDIMVGAPIFKQKITGDFLNTVLPLRHHIHGHMTFKELLLQARQNLQEAVEHQNYPMEVLLYHLGLQDTGEGFPLFDIAILLENIHDRSYLKDIRLNVVFSILKGDKHIDITLQYNARTYEKSTMERIGRHFVNALTSALANIQLPLGSLEILSAQEKERLLRDFNDTRMDFPQDRTAAGFIAGQAVKNPDLIALRCEDRELTFEHLNGNARRLAAVLRETGVTREQSVGILLSRSAWMVESILGVWYAGGAYIPIAPDYPPERIRTVLEDSCTAVLLTDTDIAFSLSKEKAGPGLACQLILVDELHNGSALPFPIDTEPACRPNDLAYIIFTSGSTGKPRGAMVEHIGMMNHLDAKINTLGITGKSIIAQNASHTFDISVWQFFSALIRGGETVIYPNDIILEPHRFIHQVRRDNVTVLEVVPSYLSVILDSLDPGSRPFDSLEYLLVTGEEVKPRQVERWFALYPGIPMVNAYGPTEASDDITHFIMDKPPGRQRIPIGKPVQNFNISILDEDMNLCPVGVKGEICVSGVGVGRGYMNDPQLTAERFRLRRAGGLFYTKVAGAGDRCRWEQTGEIFSHHSSFIIHYSDRLYRTGDLGRWLADGIIEFFGRKDHQVKIRGYRVELEEIEARLAAHPLVDEAVIVVKEKEGMEKDLYAYFTAPETGAGNSPDTGHLRDYLAGSLPDYMIPSQLVKLENMPLTANGKIDRKTLKKMGAILSSTVEFTPPTTEMEKILGKIWQKVLKLEKVSIHDIFFQMGGNSLTAITVASALKQAGFDASLIDIINHPTIAELARVIQQKASLNQPGEDIEENKLLSKLECIEKLNKGRNGKNIFIVHPMHGMVSQYKELAVLLEQHYNVYGIQARGMIPGSKMSESPGQMIDDYLEQILEVQKDGSLIMAGYCISATIAYEIVRKLENLDYPVEKLILFDPHLMFPDYLVRIYRTLEYLPDLVKRAILLVYDRKFKKAIQAGKFGKMDENGREEIISGNDLTEEQVAKYIKILGNHVLPLEFIKTPILVLQAEIGQYSHLTEAQFNKMTKSKTTVIRTPGDHDSIWAKPYVEKMAEIIMNETQQEGEDGAKRTKSHQESERKKW